MPFVLRSDLRNFTIESMMHGSNIFFCKVNRPVTFLPNNCHTLVLNWTCKPFHFGRDEKGVVIKTKDSTEKTLIALNDVFADIFNVLVFGGKQAVTPNFLEDITGISQYKADDSLLHEQERDTYKLWKNQNVNLFIMGVENQSRPDRDMPFRVIGYDGTFPGYYDCALFWRGTMAVPAGAKIKFPAQAAGQRNHTDAGALHK